MRAEILGYIKIFIITALIACCSVVVFDGLYSEKREEYTDSVCIMGCDGEVVIHIDDYDITVNIDSVEDSGSEAGRYNLTVHCYKEH